MSIKAFVKIANIPRKALSLIFVNTKFSLILIIKKTIIKSEADDIPSGFDESESFNKPNIKVIKKSVLLERFDFKAM